MNENPNRPPKKWMRDCVRGASKSARNPGAVCGALWYHKMSPAQRRAALRREGKDDAAALANPSAGATIAWVVGGAAVLVVGYLLLKPKPAAAATTQQQPALPPVPNAPQQPQAPQQPGLPPPGTWPPVAASCTPNTLSFTAWAVANGYVPVYVPTAGPPPAYSSLPGYSTQLQYALRTKVVVMTADNKFWVYYAQDDSPHESISLVNQYCATQVGPIFQFTHGVPSRMEWVT